MPLTSKGTEILSSMKKEYGTEAGEKVFYASKNAGTISGVDSAELDCALDTMAEQIGSLGTKAASIVKKMDAKLAADAAARLDAWNGSGKGNWKVHPSRSSGDRGMGEQMNAEGWSLQKVKDWCASEGYGPGRTAAFVEGWNAQEARGDAAARSDAIPTTPESTWSSKEYQQAANFLTMQLLDETPNGIYNPAVRTMREARDRYTRKAVELRQRGDAATRMDVDWTEQSIMTLKKKYQALVKEQAAMPADMQWKLGEEIRNLAAQLRVAMEAAKATRAS